MEQAVLIYDPCFKDERGVFAPLPLIFGENKIEVLRKKWLQSNVSYNPKKGTFRGMHLQLEPYAQTKLVKVINGSIIDLVIDMRPDSEDYLKVQHFYVNTDSEVYVPKGYAHGFITTQDNTVVQYLVDNHYSKSDERSIKWDSIPEIKDIVSTFLLKNHPIISEKDQNAPSLEAHQLETRGLILSEKFEWQGKDKDTIENSNVVALLAGILILVGLITLAIFNFFK